MHKLWINDARGYNMSVGAPKEKDGITTYKVSLKFDTPTVPETVSIGISYKSGDLYSTFIACDKEIRSLNPSWKPKKCDSRLAVSMPMISLISLEGKNRINVSTSDAKIPSSITGGISEDNANCIIKISLFTNPISPIESYEVTVRVDERDVRYERAIGDTVAFWEKECGYTPAPVPEAALMPLNSAWYSYHQNIDVERIVNECKLSKALGMDTLIVDDGWQTDDTNKGYAFCGDWRVASSKIPSMRDFVVRVQETGTKFMLWYSVPYIGRNSESFERFRDMLLDYSENKSWFCVDPRYPETRKFLVDTYKNALLDFGLDGFKLDFIDAFALTDSSRAPDERRDTESLEDAQQMLLSEISSTLRKINPDVLIEFRQRYVGPMVRSYGNMLRVTDCPGDPIKNRVGAIDLRLTSGGTAVHSDMLMWHKDEPSEVAATALISTLYSVPQISMRLDELSEAHTRMLRFFLSIARNYRGALLRGSLRADNPESYYSKVTGSLDGIYVTTLYTNQYDRLPEDFEEYLIVNGTGGTDVIIEAPYPVSVMLKSCEGDTVYEKILPAGISRIDAPRSSVAFIKKA